MNLKYLSDTELDSKIVALTQKEREILHEVILHVIEIDRRQLYLAYDFPSLFEYMTCHLKYSAGSAQRRIDAARLTIAVPTVVENIQSGNLTLAQASLVQKSLREFKKENHKTLSREEKHKLVELVLNQSESQTQSLLARTLNLPVVEKTLVKPQADDSIRLEISLSKEQWVALEKAKNLLSHAVPDRNLADVINYMALKVIKHSEKRTENLDKTVQNQISDRVESTGRAQNRTQKPRLSIPLSVKRILLKKAEYQCQHVNAISEHRCRSKWQLEIDHRQPIWAGGTNDIHNLQILCRKHNQRRYEEQAGIKRI